MTAKTKAAKSKGAKAEASIRDRARQILELAQKAAAASNRWVDYHNAVFGIGGPFATLFPTHAERIAFSQTEEHAKIVALLEDLMGEEFPDDEDAPAPPPDASGRFVLRLPRSVHSALVKEAEAEGVSLNQLCLAKLCVQLRAECMNNSKDNYATRS